MKISEKVIALTAETVNKILAYDPETGLFTRKTSRGGKLAGTIAGRKDPKGYALISINDTEYLAHRVAWLVSYGYWPNDQIDHKNGVKNDNRLDNLREATNGNNAHNRPLNSKNTSGHKNVTLSANGKRWVVALVVNGKSLYCGAYADLEEASEVAKAARELHIKEFVHHG